MNRKRKTDKTYCQRVAEKYSDLLMKNEIANRCLFTDDPEVYTWEVSATATEISRSPEYQELQDIILSPVKSYVFQEVLLRDNLEIDPNLSRGVKRKEFSWVPTLTHLEVMLDMATETSLYILSDQIHILESFIKSVLREQDPKRQTSVSTEDVYNFFMRSTPVEAEKVIEEAHRRSQLPTVSTRADFQDFVIAKSKEVNLIFNSRQYSKDNETDSGYSLKIGLEGPGQRKKGYEVTATSQLNLQEVYRYFEKKGILIEGALDEKDWVLWSICNNLILNGIEYFEVATIRRMLGYNSNSNALVERDIANRINKMSRIQVYRQLTYSQWDTDGALIKSDEHFDADENPPFYQLSDTERALILKKGTYEWFYLLPISGGTAVKINGQFVNTGYRMERCADIFNIATEHNQQFTIPRESLKVLRSNRGSTMRDRIYKYLITQISMQKRSCKYLFSTLCTECQLQTSNHRTRGYKIACEILDILANTGVIHSYEKDPAPRCKDLYVYKTGMDRRNYKSDEANRKKFKKPNKKNP